MRISTILHNERTANKLPWPGGQRGREVREGRPGRKRVRTRSMSHAFDFARSDESSEAVLETYLESASAVVVQQPRRASLQQRRTRTA